MGAARRLRERTGTQAPKRGSSDFIAICFEIRTFALKAGDFHHITEKTSTQI
jgi:hypothetical protein